MTPSLSRRSVIAGGTAAVAAVGMSPFGAPLATAEATPGTSSRAISLPLPSPTAGVSARRVRDLAVAFVDVGSTDARMLDLVQAAGIRRVMIVASWAWIARDGEASPDFSTLDAYFAMAAARGLSTTVHINATPGWVHPDLVGDGSFWDYIWYTPTRNDDELAAWARFCGQLAERYRGQVEGYEVWNEQNWRDFMKPVEDATLYAAMLRRAHLAIKAVDPAASIIFGGTTRSDPGFLKATYTALRSHADWREHDSFFDVMGVHPYTDSTSPDAHLPTKVRENSAGGEFDDNFLGFDRVYAEMLRHGDGHKSIFMGEFSYSVATSGSWFVVESDALRAYYLRRAYELAAQRPWIDGLAWFLFNSADAGWQDWVLVRDGYVLTRSYRELAELTGAVGSRNAVDVRARSSRGKWQFSVSVPGVVDARLYVNGVQAATSPTGTFTWTPPAALQGTTAAVQIVAFTDSQTVDSQVTFVAIGRQRVELPLTSVKTDRGVDVLVGADAHQPVRIEVADVRGRVVAEAHFDAESRRAADGTRRASALFKLPRAGRYTVRAFGRGRHQLASPSTLTVT